MDSQAAAHDLPCFRCTFTQEFHDTVIESLAELRKGNDAIIGRLDKQNGSISELYRRTNQHETAIAVLDGVGSKALADVRKDVAAISKTVTESAAEKAGAKSAWSRIQPFVMLVIAGLFGGLVVLFAAHGDLFIRR